MAVAIKVLAETNSIQQLVGSNAGSATTKAAAAAGLDREAIREIFTAKAPTAKTTVAAGIKSGLGGGAQVGVQRKIVRQAGAKAGSAKAMTVAKVGVHGGCGQSVISNGIGTKTIVAAGAVTAMSYGSPAFINATMGMPASVSSVTGGGAILSGSGLSLGLGLGLGSWGPVIVLGAGFLAYYGYSKYRSRLMNFVQQFCAKSERCCGARHHCPKPLRCCGTWVDFSVSSKNRTNREVAKIPN